MRHGFLLINKPTGPTSHDIVAIVRRVLPEQSIGHLGTLDPAAEGLLVLAVGSKALKVVELFKGLPKAYEADVRLGAVSTTYDREGVITEIPQKPGWEMPEPAAVQRLLNEKFTGKIAQVPPAASAVHIGGERAYRKMRQGRAVDLPPRDVTITECTLVSYEHPIVRLFVRCGSGTYIRSLAHDFGAALRIGGYLSALKRTEVGEWKLEHAVTAESVRWTDVLPLKEVLKSFPGVMLTAEEAKDLSFGKNIAKEVAPDTIAWCNDLPIAILEPTEDGRAHGRKVL
ncbi:tRNA pseudouridine(55) synthase TruB [Candidatus Peribacteria bacterium RIFCSPHIGHO2_02_FULL_53_20]|nr:MAG: tRNA pseudouridine(55) synthase TruB [Candidatus Peribacteria bacterium RIFCSPHIGHO2_02_FULL_53_20]OGJ67315.1 MAG: tRNA pseudouridine(55) synthase TruB [Candidatus Peribacteria bacterium RIFCSPLOWO2_01_FULL_53_10]OGJ74203.1 MAG: tRNA pseudouridine(55) synthase TruB [Candidatus Peribacteria bacterium RIFCSPLOWO2_12_FULL_53_10]